MHIRRWILVVSVCVLITATLAGYKALQIHNAIVFAESFPEQSETVEAVIAEEVPWRPVIKVMGEVKAPQTVQLRNELEGKIVKVGFNAGAKVTKDQLLVQQDITQELAQLSAAKATAQLAQLELTRYQRLIKQKLASKEQYDQASAQAAIASADMRSLRAVIEKKTLRAPFDARAGLHDLEVGQFLASNTYLTELVGINDDVWVDFHLPQEQAGLTAGARVTITAPELLTTPVTGSVFATDASVSTQSRNLRVRAVFKQLSAQLKPGEIVEVSVPAAQQRTVTVLPVTAVRYDPFGASVYVLHSDTSSAQQTLRGRAQKRTVTPGPVHNNTIIITSGVRAGEHIAADGSYKLRDGMLVQWVYKAPLTNRVDSNTTPDADATATEPDHD